MNLDRVTITGADDSISPSALAELSRKFRFVEWGILLSATSMGKPRFPSHAWLMDLCGVCGRLPELQLSLHVCGEWVRKICAGNWTPLFTNIGLPLVHSRRVQLNFRAYEHLLRPAFYPSARTRCVEKDWQLIFQCDGVNDHLLTRACCEGVNAVPLFDQSGGAGIVPGTWPAASVGIYSGYAGGLGPDNLASELPAISEAAGAERFWVDMESKVRTPDDRTFDLLAVRECLEACAPHVLRREDTTP